MKLLVFLYFFITTTLGDDLNLVGFKNILSVAKYNSNQIEKTIRNNSKLIIPAGTYYIHPIYCENLINTTLQINGKLVAHSNVDQWPKYKDIFFFYNTQNLSIQGNGTVDGSGAVWWKHLIKHRKSDHRGNMFRFKKAKHLSITGIRAVNSPKFYYNIKNSNQIFINNIEINTDWDKNQHYFPFNTDGIDVQGYDVIISNIKITNYDDAVAIKPFKKSSCSRNILVENISVKYGVGASIGSVPPNPDTNCVQNVTFRNIVFHKPIKAIYIKTNPGSVGNGIISNITYENIKIHSPQWFSLYVGPQQQHEPDGKGPGCMLYPVEKCPTQPRITIENISFRNITSDSSTLNVMRCNETNPCKNFMFDNVNIKGHFIVENILWNLKK